MKEEQQGKVQWPKCKVQGSPISDAVWHALQHTGRLEEGHGAHA